MSKLLENMTLDELEVERDYWERELVTATTRGAHLAAVNGYRLGCIAWIAKRRLEQQAKP